MFVLVNLSLGDLLRKFKLAAHTHSICYYPKLRNSQDVVRKVLQDKVSE